MKNLQNKKAFSLIELSIVLLIIGIIIAGITQSSRLVSQFKLSSARAQTESSPVNSISGLVAWYDAASERSFSESESDDRNLTSGRSDNDGVTTWYDLSQTSGSKNNATQSSGNSVEPYYYSDCINDLPCVRFDGTDDHMDFDGSAIVGTDYTIFVVEQRDVAAAGYFLASSDTTPAANDSLQFGYTGSTALTFGQGDFSNYYSATLTVAYNSALKPALHTFTNGSTAITSGDKQFYYESGSATAISDGSNPGFTDTGSPALSNLSGYSNAAIGVGGASGATYYDGAIGEIIIYDRYLKGEERVAVEDYLIKKWGINGLD